jgi:SagB-type dehydrogenase family enzyme
VANVAGIPAGLYHYEPRTHTLHRLRAGDIRTELAAVVAHDAALAGAPFALVLSSIYYKSSYKYQERAYRYCLLDAGHVAANAIVAGRALGLATRPIARFDDAALGALLAIDPHRQGPFVVLPFGAPVSPPTVGSEAGFAPVDLYLAYEPVPSPVMLVASRTALRLTGQRITPPQPSPAMPPRATVAAQSLAPATGDGDAIDRVIERRRSERNFGSASLSAAQLATVLRRARAGSVEDQRALRLHVVVSRVDGVSPGAYEVHEDALVPVNIGQLAEDIHAAALSQEVSGNAAAVLVFSVDATRMRWPDASRGFRYGWLDAGIAAGRVYLMAVALGLGASSIGAFFDDDVAALLRLDVEADYPALLVALGPKG